MNNTTKIIIAVVIGLVIGVGGAMAYTSGSAKPTAVATNTQTTTSSMSMQDEMASMNAGLQGKTGNAFDQEFLSEMTVHHQGAVEMAQLALQNAKHPEIKQLAQGIISAQDKEITEMQAWQKAWYGAAASTTNNSMPEMQMTK
jgi:uncharacterized protein (DUF305 family)